MRTRAEKRPPLSLAQLAPLAKAQVSRMEMARILKRSVGHVDKRLHEMKLGTSGEEVTRERAWLALGHLVIREHVGASTRWTNAARSWEGDPMSAPYLEALLSAGLLVRVETSIVETYRHAYAKPNPDGDD